MFGICFVHVLYLFFRKKPHLIIWVVLGLSLTFVFNQEFIILAYDKVHLVLGSDVNGFGARYSETGILNGNIDYISQNPFRALGIGFKNGLFFGDSGFIEHTLRGTMLLTIIFYTTFYLFLRKNLINTRLALILFAVDMIFELGNSFLFYFRTAFILPFIIIVLNYLEKQKNTNVNVLRGSESAILKK